MIKSILSILDANVVSSKHAELKGLYKRSRMYMWSSLLSQWHHGLWLSALILRILYYKKLLDGNHKQFHWTCIRSNVLALFLSRPLCLWIVATLGYLGENADTGSNPRVRLKGASIQQIIYDALQYFSV